MSEHINNTVKAVGDITSIATVIGTLMNILPAIAALFTIIWTAIRIYETVTVQKMLGNKDAEHK